jgi:hypothetical protein
MLVLSALAGWTVLEDGFHGRSANAYEKPLGAMVNYNPYQRQAYERCYSRLPWLREQVRCAVFGDNPGALLIGDSHAESMFLSAEEQGGSDFPHVRIDSPACLPFVNYVTRFPMHTPRAMECNLLAPSLLRALPEFASIETVIIVARGSFYFTAEDFAQGPNTGHPIHRLSDDRRLLGVEGERAFVDGYTDLVKRLLSMGKQVVFVLEWPELDFDPRACVHRQVPWHYRENCFVPRQKVEMRQFRYRQLVDEIRQAVPEMKVYDPLPVLCDDSRCMVRVGDSVYYRDDDHLSPEGGNRVLADFLGWYRAR